MAIIELRIPKTLSSQTIRTITTTTFKIVLMLRSIGIKELMSHSRTPTTMITSKIVNSGINIILNYTLKFNPHVSISCYIILELSCIIHTFQMFDSLDVWSPELALTAIFCLQILLEEKFQVSSVSMTHGHVTVKSTVLIN